ncbi:MAG: FAD-binding oxidoreductase [Candidatus Delongbacteria bacterium]|nr:FAD-binding oxidoreductase [Candidatus Delongbacteria bacterium]
MKNEIYSTASNCRHYAMCKIDYLGTGLCASGPERGFVTFYPQGRMDLYKALADGTVPVTPAAVEAAETCTLCGICDKQCYFITELRPVRVMKALKELVSEYVEKNGMPEADPDDLFLKELKKITGERFSTSDPAVLTAYSHDPCPVAPARMPAYACVPGSKNEVEQVVKLCAANSMPYAVRGNGSSVMGFVMSEGVVIDLIRMKEIIFDERNWKVTVGPGVTSFELQKAATARGYRVNAAEPAAMVCGNLMCSGIFSLFSASYGIGADNIITAEFVGPDGNTFKINEQDSPNLYAYEKKDSALRGICVSAQIKLHRKPDDETGVLVPFEDLKEAVSFAKELSFRRIGSAIGVLGGEYLSVFTAPSTNLASKIKTVFTKTLKMNHPVLVIGDKFDMQAVRSMKPCVIENDLFSTIYLGLPSLAESKWTDLIAEMSGEREPYEFLTEKSLKPLIEAALDPSPENIASAFPRDLSPFFEKAYSDPDFTDLVKLNEFRILSSRMGREKHVLAIIVYTPADPDIISELNSGFAEIGDRNSLKHDYGFVTPLDSGKRAVFEYDYYLDHTDQAERNSAGKALGEIAEFIGRYSGAHPEVKWIRYTLYQGFCRKEHILYVD